MAHLHDLARFRANLAIACAQSRVRRMVQGALGPQDEAADAERQTSSLAGLALVLGLVVAGLYLVDALRACAPLACLAR